MRMPSNPADDRRALQSATSASGRAILGFWLAYILTRPLGGSFRDLLSQPVDDGGPGFGTIVTRALSRRDRRLGPGHASRRSRQESAQCEP